MNDKVKRIEKLTQEEIADCNNEIDKAKKKLEENYCYNFEWDYPAVIYKNQWIKNYLGTLITFINNEPQRCEEWLNHNIDECLRQLTERDIIQHSSSKFSNLAYLYKLECQQYLLKQFRLYIKLLTSNKTQ